MSEQTSINWQQLYRHRRAIAQRFGAIWDIPVRKRYHQVLSDLGEAGISLLEIGAGNRGLAQRMGNYWSHFDYRSCDIDDTYEHDFGHISKIEGRYDVICAFEVIEHMPLQEAADMLVKLRQHLKPGGRLVLTTPNTFYPPAFLRDATHITPFCFDELAGLVNLAGFRVQSIYRLYHDALFKKFIRRIVMYPLFRLLGIDYAKQILVVAENPG